jgi:hypothetical protein
MLAAAPASCFRPGQSKCNRSLAQYRVEDGCWFHCGSRHLQGVRRPRAPRLKRGGRSRPPSRSPGPREPNARGVSTPRAVTRRHSWPSTQTSSRRALLVSTPPQTTSWPPTAAAANHPRAQGTPVAASGAAGTAWVSPRRGSTQCSWGQRGVGAAWGGRGSSDSIRSVAGRLLASPWAACCCCIRAKARFARASRAPTTPPNARPHLCAEPSRAGVALGAGVHLPPEHEHVAPVPAAMPRGARVHGGAENGAGRDLRGGAPRARGGVEGEAVAQLAPAEAPQHVKGVSWGLSGCVFGLCRAGGEPAAAWGLWPAAAAGRPQGTGAPRGPATSPPAPSAARRAAGAPTP